MTTIIDLSNKQPRAFIKVSLGVGARSTAASPIKVLLLGNATSSGSWASAEDIHQVFTEEEVIAGAGVGSELHRQYLFAANANPNADFYVGVIAESAGANASGTITITGTATESGTLRITIAEEEILVAIANGDTHTAVMNAARDAINNLTHLPVTAAVSTTLDLTARQKGPRGNTIRFRYEFTEGGAGLTMTPSAGAYFSGGTTNDDPANILAVAAAERYHLIVSPYATTAESTAIDKVIAHVNSEAEPLAGHRGRAIMANHEALATAVSLATTDVNEARVQIAWHYNSPIEPAVVAASFAGTISAGLGTDRAYNFDGEELTDLDAQWSNADRPTPTEINSGLNNGLTPLGATGGNVTITRSVTSFSEDASGNKDFRVLDTHYVDVPDFLADELEQNFGTAFKGFKLGVDVEGEMPPPGVATANTVKAWALNLLGAYDNDLIENFDSVTLATSKFTRNEVAKGRIDAEIPVDVIELLHQFAGDIRQIN